MYCVECCFHTHNFWTFNVSFFCQFSTLSQITQPWSPPRRSHLLLAPSRCRCIVPTLLDQTQLENWFTGTTVGLHMTKPQMEAVKAQGLNDPSDLFDMSKEDIARLFKTLKSRTYEVTGKQLQTFVLTSGTVSRLHVCAEIVKYLFPCQP